MSGGALRAVAVQGVLRGAGKHTGILLYNLCGFWGVGVTSGAALTFGFGWGLQGLWMGILLGICTTAALNFQGVHKLDWAAEAAAAARSVGGVKLDASGAGGVSLATVPAEAEGGSEERWLLGTPVEAVCAQRGEAAGGAGGAAHEVDEM